MTGAVLLVLAVAFLSPCLVQSLDDKDDFTGRNGTKLFASCSRRPRSLIFPRVSQLLVRREYRRFRTTRLMSRLRGQSGIHSRVTQVFAIGFRFFFRRSRGIRAIPSNEPSAFPRYTRASLPIGCNRGEKSRRNIVIMWKHERLPLVKG